MKKLICFFAGILLVMPNAFAAPAQEPDDTLLVTAEYVNGAYQALDGAKQDELADGGTVVQSGAGNVVTGVSATEGTVTVTKGRVEIPVGSSTATDYSPVWVQ